MQQCAPPSVNRSKLSSTGLKASWFKTPNCLKLKRMELTLSAMQPRHRNAPHQSFKHWQQSAACLRFAPLISFNHSSKSSWFCFSKRNWPRTTYALSYPSLQSLSPRTSPMPARSVTGLSPIGSATKLRCFCDVLDIITAWLKFLLQ